MATYTISNSAQDDGWEDDSGGTWEDGGVTFSGEPDLNQFSATDTYGIRFNSIVAGQADTVDTATLRLFFDEVYKNPECTIYCNDIDNAVAFTSTLPSARTKTTSTGTTQQGTSQFDYSTVNAYVDIDVSGPVQEILNRPGWSSGNSIAFLMNCANDSFGFIRDYDAAGSVQPEFILETSSGAASIDSINSGNDIINVQQDVSLTFSNIDNITKVELIQGATVVLQNDLQTGASSLTFDVVQGALVLNIATTLRITYDSGGSTIDGNTTLIEQSAGNNFYITVTDDDGIDDTTSFDNDGSANILSIVIASVGGAGWRFNGVTIERFSQVTSANLSLYAVQAYKEPQVILSGIDSDDCPSFTSTIPSNQTLTTANVTKDIITGDPFGTSPIAAYIDFDVTAIVQEIIDRAGWNSGNAIGFTATVSGMVVRDLQIYDINEGAQYRPVLNVEVSSSPIINNIDIDDIIQVGQTAVNINGVNLGTVTRVALNDGIIEVEQSNLTTVNGQQVRFDVAQGGLAYGFMQAKITAGGVDYIHAITLDAPTDKSFVTVANAANNESSISYGDATPPDGDIIEYELLTITNNQTVIISPDLSFRIGGGIGSDIIRIRHFEQSTRTWSSSIDITVSSGSVSGRIYASGQFIRLIKPVQGGFSSSFSFIETVSKSGSFAASVLFIKPTHGATGLIQGSLSFIKPTFIIDYSIDAFYDPGFRIVKSGGNKHRAKIYPNRDNIIRIQILNAGTPYIDVDKTTRSVFKVFTSTSTITLDSNVSPNAFNFAIATGQMAIDTGEITTLTDNELYSAELVIYNNAHPQGVVVADRDLFVIEGAA